MPTVTVKYPRGLFDATDKVRFKRAVKKSVAKNMEAINPYTGQRTDFADNVDRDIDVLLEPYDSDDAELTVLCLGTIVTYGWPDRLVNLDDRIENITNDACRALPEHSLPIGRKSISFTFIPKPPGGWAEA